MHEIKVFTKNQEGEKLVGLKTYPETKQGKYPIVLLVHGFGVTKHESGMFDKLAELISAEGFLVYRFDFSGCGESEGDYSNTTLTKQRDELKNFLEYIQKDKEADNTNIAILAQSFGTAVTVALGPQVKTIILMGSIAHPFKVISSLFGNKFNKDGPSERTRESGNITYLEPLFWKDAKTYNLLENIKKINSPVLFVHGKIDEKVPLSEMKEYLENTKNSEKLILKKACHDLNPQREAMHEVVIEWLNKNLQ